MIKSSNTALLGNESRRRTRMKKSIALILATVMVLSFVSGAAMAEGLEPGLYGSADNGVPVFESKYELTIDNGVYYEVPYTEGATTVYYYNLACTALELDGTPEGNGQVNVEQIAEGLFCIALTEAAGDVIVQLRLTRTDGSSGECIIFSDGTSGGSGGGNEGVAQHPLQEAEKFPRVPEDTYQLGEFTYNNETYYLSPIVLVDEQSGTFGMGHGASNPPSAGQPWQYAVGFYRNTPNGYVLVDNDTRTALLTAFGDSLSLSLLALENPDSLNYPNYATHYPAALPWDGLGWPCGVTHIYTAETAGSWLYIADGEIGGTSVSAYSIFRYEPQKRVIKDDFSSIAEINAWLQDFAEENANTGTSCILILSAGEFVGNIYVPENLEVVTISGSTDSSGNNATTIIGGVEANSKVLLVNLDFEGANAQKSSWQHWERNWSSNWHDDWGRKLRSQWDAKWPSNSDTTLEGKDNYGIWGDFPVLYDYCSFRGYYHAVHNSEVITFGGDNSLFEDNAVAIYFDTNGWGGNLTMTENTFKHNGCAFYFERFSDKHTMVEYQLIRCKFIDNPIEVINRSNLHFFLHGNYFKWGNSVGEVCAPSANVHAFPYATNEACTAFAYSAEDVVMLNNQTMENRSVTVPSANLDGKTITLMDDRGEKTVATWVFDD